MPIAILYGKDGGVLRAISIDASGHLQVDALTLPAGLATEASLQKLVNALATVATDKLRASIVDALPAGLANIGDVDVVSSALPTGAATSANQTTMITALQLIDDLRNALASVLTDVLAVTPIARNVNSGLLTFVGTGANSVKASAGNVYWFAAYAEAALAEWSLRDGGAAGVTKYVIRANVQTHVHALFNPPIRCATNIYVANIVAGAGSEFMVGYI